MTAATPSKRPKAPEKPFAFIGVRACDIRAMTIQDRVFEGGTFVDTHYQARRQNAFIVAVNCAEAAPTCFCASMESGPKAERDFDLALTELDPWRRSSLLGRESEPNVGCVCSIVPA